MNPFHTTKKQPLNTQNTQKILPTKTKPLSVFSVFSVVK
jgi:hypothetical protein